MARIVAVEMEKGIKFFGLESRGLIHKLKERSEGDGNIKEESYFLAG